MATSSRSEVLRPTVIDRLISDEGRSSFEGVSVRELKASVARDVEWLLNTRVLRVGAFERLEQARESLLTYGLPDLSVYSWAKPDDARSIAALIEDAIRRFEPRIQPRSLRCEVMPAADVADFSLRIRIEAVLDVDPILEPVVFDSGLDLSGGGLRIESFE